MFIIFILTASIALTSSTFAGPIPSGGGGGGGATAGGQTGGRGDRDGHGSEGEEEMFEILKTGH